METYLTLKEAADLLRVSEKTVRDWVKQRKLPAFQINRTMRISRRVIEASVHSPLPPEKRSPEEQQVAFERLHRLRQQLADRQGVLSDLLLEAREEMESDV